MPSVTSAPPPNPAAFDQCLKYLNQETLYNLAGSRMTAPNDKRLEHGGEKLVEGELGAINQKGETLISGTFVASLPSRGSSGP